MAIYRANKHSCYTQISNELINNTYISLKATMLLIKMLSKPKDWHFTIDGLVDMCKEGRTAVKSALKELEDAGHVFQKRYQKANGQIDYDYDVYEIPQKERPQDRKPAEEKPQAKKQTAEKPTATKPQTENHPTAYYYITNKEKTNNEEQIQNNKICESVISHLNALIGSAYKPTSKANRELISGLISEGFTESELITVIDKKYAEWNGTDWAWCLRPSTLFGRRFEDYLNAAPRPKTSSQEAQYGACGLRIQTPPVNDPLAAFLT